MSLITSESSGVGGTQCPPRSWRLGQTMLWVTINRARRAASPSLSLVNSHVWAWRHPEGEKTSAVSRVKGKGVKWQLQMGTGVTCPQLMLSRAEGEHFSPGTCCKGQEGEVGGSQQGLRWCIPTAFTCIFLQYYNLMERVDWQMPSKTLQKDKKSHRKARLCNFLKDKIEHVHYKQTHLHIPHTHALCGSPLTLSVSLIKKKI